MGERRWSLFSKFQIPDYDSPWRDYLVRYRIFQTPAGGLYLHRINARDPRDTIHSHPWPFASLVLWGGYHEVTPKDIRHVRWFNLKRSADSHAIISLDRTPTWTLVLVGRKVREWGYYDPDGSWTRHDLHPNAAAFEAALEWRRQQGLKV